MTKVIMGPLGTQILADQGAEVITVEGPGVQSNRVMGDYAHDELSGISLNLLRNKKSVELDLSDPEGIQSLRRLIAGADVLITTLRPGSMRRLGLDYESCKALKNDLIYCHAQGYPVGSGSEDEPAYDDVIQAASGVADITERTWGSPVLLPTIIADKVAGMMVAQAVSAGLYERSVTGRGQSIEIPMAQTFASFMLVEHGSGAIYSETSPSSTIGSGYRRLLTPERRPHETRDGYVHLFPYNPAHYASLFSDYGTELDVPEALYADKRAVLENSNHLYAHVRAIAKQLTTREWLAYCRSQGIPVTEVRTIDDMVSDLEVADHPVVGKYRVIRPMANFGNHDFVVRHHAPLKGEHTRDYCEAVEKGGL